MNNMDTLFEVASFHNGLLKIISNINYIIFEFNIPISEKETQQPQYLITKSDTYKINQFVEFIEDERNIFRLDNIAMENQTGSLIRVLIGKLTFFIALSPEQKKLLKILALTKKVKTDMNEIDKLIKQIQKSP